MTFVICSFLSIHNLPKESNGYFTLNTKLNYVTMSTVP